MKKGNKRSKGAKATKRSTARRAAKAKKASRRIGVQLPAGASAADRREAEHFVETLEANKQLACEPGPLPPGATHQLETDDSGTKRVVRKRFSAI